MTKWNEKNRDKCCCIFQELSGIQSRMESESLGKIQTPLVSLDTPGKATVQVTNMFLEMDGQNFAKGFLWRLNFPRCL